MSIVRKGKDIRHSVLERRLFDLRDRAKNGALYVDDMFGVKAFKKGARDNNAAALRTLWPLYRDASEYMELLQRIYIAQRAYSFSAITEVMSADGHRYEVTGSLDPWRTHKPKALSDFLSYDVSLYHKQHLDDETVDAAVALMSEYCETLAQDTAPAVVLSIHNPTLLTRYHETRAPEARWSMLSVNLDKEFTWAQRERPIYRRRAFTVEAAGLTTASLGARLSAHQDSMRLFGEKLETHGCTYDRPALNILVAVMQEVSGIIHKVRHELQKVNEGIMRECADYRGFQYVGKNVLISEAKSMRYAEGVTVTNAVSPVQTRQHGPLNIGMMRGLIAAGAINLDTPRIALRMKAQTADLPRQPDYGPLWAKGRAAIIKSIDPTIKKLIAAYSEKDCGKLATV